MTEPQPDPDAVIVWFPVAPTGKGLRDQERHAFGAGWLAVVLDLAEAGGDPAELEIPAVCNKVFKLAELQHEGHGAPCQPCMAVVPLQPPPASKARALPPPTPKPHALPQRFPGEYLQMVQNYRTIAVLTIYVHGDQDGYCPACKDHPKAPCKPWLDADRNLQLMS